MTLLTFFESSCFVLGGAADNLADRLEGGAASDLSVLLGGMLVSLFGYQVKNENNDNNNRGQHVNPQMGMAGWLAGWLIPRAGSVDCFSPSLADRPSDRQSGGARVRHTPISPTLSESPQKSVHYGMHERRKPVNSGY